MTEGVTAEESQLLVEGMGAVFGGAIRTGAVAAVKRMRVNLFETDVTLRLPLAKAVARVKSLLEEAGSLIDEGPADNGHRLRGMMGAGSMNMNPTVVTVTLSETGPSATAARIRAVAKEGLIKQRAGQKAAERVAGLLQA
jgi:hypothetical protein